MFRAIGYWLVMPSAIIFNNGLPALLTPLPSPPSRRPAPARSPPPWAPEPARSPRCSCTEGRAPVRSTRSVGQSGIAHTPCPLSRPPAPCGGLFARRRSCSPLLVLAFGVALPVPLLSIAWSPPGASPGQG